MTEAEKRIALSKRIDAAIHDRDNIGIWPRRVFAGTPEDWEIILAALSDPILTAESALSAKEDRLAEVEAALETLLAKCPNCGGTGMVETGRIQFGYPSDSPCGLCANERKVFDAA